MNFEKILQLESEIEHAWCAVLQLRGGKALPEFSDAKRVRPDYEVKLTGVSETYDGGWIIVDGVRKPGRWKGTLVTRTVTKRGQSSEQQGEMIGRVRAAAFAFEKEFNAALNFHTVDFMRETTTQRSHQPEGDWDITEQHHEIMFQLRTA